MKYKVDRNKGSSLPVVFVSIAVLIILVGVLVESVGQWYKSMRGNETEEYTYISAESAIERCFNNLNTVITPVSYTNGMTWSNDDAFANNVIAKIQTDGSILKDYTGSNSIQIFESATAPKSEVSITIQRGKGILSRTAGNSKLSIPIALTAKANLTNGGFSSMGRTVYAEKNFEVFVPNEFELNGAIYSLGDVFAVDGVTANIKGDVYTFGTCPEKVNEPNQNYYGGILAIHNSVSPSGSGTNLIIDGNAYSRSFIRAGKAKGILDKSQIRVTKDAIAQGIQIFGNENKIIVYRNAYTFDDLEVDGEDSVIAVNGSYFGLSKGDGAHHDASSAIVNAAPIHLPNINSDASKKSRIVINGDVLINGGTFKLDEITNACEFQIEDASLAWHNGNPAYRDFGGNNTTDYINQLKSWHSSSLTDGFGNIIQMWNRFSYSDINSWITEIDNVRKDNAGINDFTKISAANKGPAFTSDPDDSYVTGYCNNVMASNNNLYFIDKSDTTGSSTKIKQIAHLNDNTYELDNVDVPTGFSDWKAYWDDIAGVPDTDWPSVYCSGSGKIDSMFKYLRSKLLNVIDVFTTRTYPPQNEGAAIVGTDVTNIYNAAPADVDGSTPENKFMYLADYLDFVFTTSDPSTNCVLKYPSSSGRTESNLIDDLNTEGVFSADYDTEHFLVINLDPDNTIKVKEAQVEGDNKDSFNGIIFSLGRVEVDKGITINGAIIAAGRGMEPFSFNSIGDNDGSAAQAKTDTDPSSGVTETKPRLPQVLSTGLNYSTFIGGSYAGVIIGKDGTTGLSTTIDFPGRTSLLNSFYTQSKSIDLYSIF